MTRSVVSILHAQYDNIDIKTLLAPLGGMRNIINKGERVLLKVNLLQASEPKNAVTTHPAIVMAVARSVLDVGGVPYIGDSPAGRFSQKALDKIYEVTGMKSVAKNLGIELNYDTSTTVLNIPHAKRLKKTRICNFVLNAEKIIALPKLKTHSLMVMTLATKIMFGAIPGLTKAKYHSLYPRLQSFADMLLDVLSVVTPNLYVMDGIVAMEGNGPAAGSPVNLRLMFASKNAVAMDLAICKVLDIEPMGVPVLKRARIRGLWPESIEYPLKDPEEVKFVGFKLPVTAGKLAKGIVTSRRIPVPGDKCTGCGRCVEICPKNAIEIVNGMASVDYTKCIRCYCCHEICPMSAIKLMFKGVF